jgi:uncharacterized OsmC-like protein
LTTNTIHVEVDDDVDTTKGQNAVQKVIDRCWQMWSN